jgi:hypothetical protein
MMPMVKNSISAANPVATATAAYANYYTMMDPSAVNYINQATAAAKPIETQYNKDPRSRRSNSRERRQRSRSPERRRRSRSPSDSDRERDGGTRRRTRFSERTEPVTMMPKVSTNSYSVPPPVGNVWDAPPPQIFNTANNSVLPTRNYQTENNSNGSSAFGNIGTCVKVSNVDNDTFYSDLRKFFVNLPIGNNDIKFVTDGKGNRTGVVLIRFLSSDSKKKALTKNMWQLKSTQVMITSITEEDFESGLQKTISSRRNDDRYDDKYDRERDRSYRSRSNSRERERDSSRNYNKFDNSRNYNNRDRDRDRDGGFRKNFKQENRFEKPKEYEPDENFTVLMLDDIPRTANEPDICEAFPNIKSIIIDRYTAYVKFISHEAAKVILENRFIHNISNKRVFLYPASEAQFNDLARELGGKFDNPEHMDVKNVDDDTNHSSHSNSNDSRNRDQKPAIESRDPRQRNLNDQRNFNDPRNFNGNQQETIKTDCVIMKGMELNTTIEDVEAFYKDIGIYKMRVHILLDKRGECNLQMINFIKNNCFYFTGNPSGDCFVEFKYPNDSYRAISKNNQLLKSNRVQVMLIPREQVDAVLSSFGGNRNDNNRPPMNRRQDWAPPNDFGMPGCVVMLSNLCYRASTNDILDEFREFNLNPDQIIRKYNDMG